MKYTIVINQLAASEYFQDLDLIDLAIFDYVKSFTISSEKSEKIKTFIFENELYVWINYNHLLKEMPVLQLNQKASISKRLEKLEKSKLIKRREMSRNIYVRMGEKANLMEFESLARVNTSLAKTNNNHPRSLAQANSTISISVDNNISDTIATKVAPVEDKENLELLRGVVEYYKVLRGFDKVKGWDRTNFPMNMKYAKRLAVNVRENSQGLTDWDESMLLDDVKDCLNEFEEWGSVTGLTWNLATVVRRFGEYMNGTINREIKSRKERKPYVKNFTHKGSGYWGEFCRSRTNRVGVDRW